MTFGEKLKAARERANLTQTMLAESSGISLRTIQNWENGVRKPSKLESVAKVAETLKVSATDLLALIRYSNPSLILVLISSFCKNFLNPEKHGIRKDLQTSLPIILAYIQD